MGREKENDTWESLLEQAVAEYGKRELEQFLPEEIEKLKLPDDYDKHMRSWIKRYKVKAKMAAMLKPLRTTAAAACLILGIGFAFLLQFDEVRAACRDVIIQIYEKYIEFNYQKSDQDENGDIQIDYIPDGFFETERTVSKLKTTIKYRTEYNESIIITCSVKDLTLQIDNEHHYILEETVNGNEATFFEEKEKGWDNYLVWKGEHGYYCITSTLNKSEMKKIAENIK